MALAAVAAVAAVLGGVASGRTVSAGSASARQAGAGGLYWGAWLPSPAPWEWSPVSSFERMVGKRMSIVEFGVPFTQCTGSGCKALGFPTSVVRKIRSHGKVPLISWSSSAIPASLRQPSYSLAAVASGRWDGLIRSFAREARAWAHPFFLRFDWEMNGPWSSWSAVANGNRPGDYVAAWRHVHGIFTSVGARNATWVWCPNVDPFHHLAGLRPLYPGNAYVDWTCLDGYNHGTLESNSGGWLSFDQMFAKSYRTVARLAPSKPMLIGEVASTVYGGSKPRWIAGMLSRLPRAYPKIHGVVYFDRDEGPYHWPLTTSASAVRAFAHGIHSRAYFSNAFCRLSGNPIAPPGAVARARCGA